MRAKRWKKTQAQLDKSEKPPVVNVESASPEQPAPSAPARDEESVKDGQKPNVPPEPAPAEVPKANDNKIALLEERFLKLLGHFYLSCLKVSDLQKQQIEALRNDIILSGNICKIQADDVIKCSQATQDALNRIESLELLGGDFLSQCDLLGEM